MAFNTSNWADRNKSGQPLSLAQNIKSSM